MSIWKYHSISEPAGSCSLVKKEKQFYFVLGTLRKESEPKPLLDIDPLSSEQL